MEDKAYLRQFATSRSRQWLIPYVSTMLVVNRLARGNRCLWNESTSQKFPYQVNAIVNHVWVETSETKSDGGLAA